MPPQTIDEVRARLNEIIGGALRPGHRIDYFASLNERVTTDVRRATSRGSTPQSAKTSA